MHTACSFPTDDPAVFALSSPRAVRYWSSNFESRPSTNAGGSAQGPCTKFHLPESIVRDLVALATELGISASDAVVQGIAALRKIESERVRDIPVGVGSGTVSLRGRIVARTILRGSQWTFIVCTDGTVAGSSKEALLVAKSVSELLEDVEHITKVAVPADVIKALRPPVAPGLGE
ncbi:MAG: hypothetical protein ACP5OR_05975 [Candidatus Dormibacteria bacterium]